MNIDVLRAPISRSEWKLLGISSFILAALFASIIASAHGTFIYIQDDAYIHLQIARTLAESGTWGITAGHFASASSSPVWTLLLAIGFLILGAQALYVPLIINIVAVLAIVLVLHRILQNFGVTGVRGYAALAGVAIVTPLGPFAFSGMEHALHMIAVLVFVCAVAEVVTYAKPTRSATWVMLIITPFVTGLRYEGIFIVAMACGFLLLRKRFGLLVLVAVLGMLPLGLFGWYSLAHGGHFVPNTLLVKKNLAGGLVASLKGLAASAYVNIKTPLFMLFTVSLLTTILYRIRRDGSIWRTESIALAIFSGSFILQSVFGKLSWVPMFRYEAYLILGGTLFLFACLRDIPIRRIIDRRFFSWSNTVLFALLLLVSLPLLRRAISYPYENLNARDIHAGTYSTARFFADEYPGADIGTIDIGMVSYFGTPNHVRVIDFWGLADNDVAEARLEGTYSSTTMEALAAQKDVHVLALFDSWLNALIPTSWVRVARWDMPKNVTLGSDTISFYAPTCADAPVLEQRMRTFAPELPPEVQLTMLNWTAQCAKH